MKLEPLSALFALARKAKHRVSYSPWLLRIRTSSRFSRAPDALWGTWRHLGFGQRDVDGLARLVLGRPPRVTASYLPVPRRLFVFWTGTNPLTPNRLAGLQALKSSMPTIEVVMIDRSNLGDWLVEPLHPAYECLSAVHKSDYLRCYFMHHHGGAYSDIKPPTSDWAAVFDELEADEHSFAAGYPLESSLEVAAPLGKSGDVVRREFRRLVGVNAYIFRPHSDFSQEWLRRVNLLLDDRLSQLQAAPGNIWGDNEGYPIEWNEVLGQIFHPLNFAFSRGFRQDSRLRTLNQNYR